jgi:hypothetical protein
VALIPVCVGLDTPVRLTTYLACVTFARAVMEAAITTKVCSIQTMKNKEMKRVGML